MRGRLALIETLCSKSKKQESYIGIWAETSSSRTVGLFCSLSYRYEGYKERQTLLQFGFHSNFFHFHWYLTPQDGQTLAKLACNKAFIFKEGLLSFQWKCNTSHPSRCGNLLWSPYSPRTSQGSCSSSFFAATRYCCLNTIHSRRHVYFWNLTYLIREVNIWLICSR